MKVRVIRLFEAGWKLPRWQLAFQRGDVGRLLFDTWHDQERHRTVQRLRLVDQLVSPILPPLLEPRIIWVGEEDMRVEGVETYTPIGNTLYYVQSWSINVKSPDTNPRDPKGPPDATALAFALSPGERTYTEVDVFYFWLRGPGNSEYRSPQPMTIEQAARHHPGARPIAETKLTIEVDAAGRHRRS